MSDTPQAEQAPQTCGMATAALVCGILGLTCVPIVLPIIAVVLGHSARSSIRKSEGRLSGSGLALGGLVMGYLGIGVIVLMVALAMILPAFARMHPAAYEANDMSNLKQLHVGLMMYADDNDNTYPADLATLAESDALPAGRVYKHPADKSDPPQTAADIRNGNCGYVFTAGGIRLVEIEDAANTILIYSLPRSMHISTCVVMANGEVKKAPGEDIESICKLNGWTLPKPKKPDKPKE